MLRQQCTHTGYRPGVLTSPVVYNDVCVLAAGQAQLVATIHDYILSLGVRRLCREGVSYLHPSVGCHCKQDRLDLYNAVASDSIALTRYLYNESPRLTTHYNHPWVLALVSASQVHRVEG